jgi:hypothetical protein
MEYRPMEKKLGNYIEKSLIMLLLFLPKFILIEMRMEKEEITT